MRKKRNSMFYEVIAACEEKEIYEIMELRQDWNMELVSHLPHSLGRDFR